MRKQLLFGAGVLAAGCLAWAAGARPGVSAPVPEHTLAGIRLGRSYLDVLRLYGGPDEVQTVAVPSTPGEAPAGGEATPGGFPGAMPGGFPRGGGFPGMMGGMSGGGGMRASGGGFPGMMGGPRGPGMMAGMSGMAGSGGGSGMGRGKFGSMMGGAGPDMGGPRGMGGGAMGSPYASPTGSGGGGFGPLPAAGGGFGGPDVSGTGPEAPAGPEYSSALMWVYRKPNNVRLEFLINEDGRVAQISVAAPMKNITNSIPSLHGPVALKTARDIRLGSSYATVVSRYGFPERTRLIPGGRFEESYYTRNYHCAFTEDILKKNSVVRITVTLAD